MASGGTTDVFNCTPEQFFKIISDYEKYSEFLQEVKQAKILKTEGTRKLVEYQVQVIKSFKYTLWMTEKEDSMVSWEFAGGDLFKTSNGHWKIEAEGGKTRGIYHVDATFNLFVPGPIAKTLVNVNLPNMISSYHKRVAELYGR